MKVCIDPGHGGQDPGAIFRAVAEKNIVLAIALDLERMLRHTTIVPVMTRGDDRTLRLKDRVDVANQSNADLFVSIHCNADPDPDLPGMPEARGEEIFHASNSAKGKDLANAIADGLKREFPMEPFRGIKERDLYVVARTRMPAVLVEVAFIDHSVSVNQLRDPAVRGRIAFAILRGILWYERLHH